MKTWASRLRWILLLSIALWGLVVSPAAAYIDPGSTSMVFQALIAAAMAAGLTIKMFWRRIRSWFSREASEQDDTVA